MSEENKKTLVERYYTWEKSVWIVALLLIVWQVFGLNDATSLPLLDVKLRDPGKFPLVTSIILAVGSLFLWIEWKQSDEIARRASISRIRFGITLILAVAAVWLNLAALTKGTAIADIPRLWLVGYFALGVFTGICFSMVTLTKLTARFQNKGRTGLLQYTPAATQFVYWHCFKMLFASWFILNVASKFAPIEILAIVPWLVGVPAIALLAAEISGYFFFHHCGDNPLSMPQQISDLKETLPRNRYLNFLDTHRQDAVVKITSNPRLTSQQQQQAVRKYLAKNNYGVAPLVIKPLEDFKVSFFPKDGDSSNQAKNNLGIKIELGDLNRKSVKFRIWPEGEDPPKITDELDVKVGVLEHFAVTFFEKIENEKSTGDDALDYIVTSSISQTLREEREAVFPLHAAGMSGNHDILEEYLSKGKDINERDKAGWTPLLHAVANGHPKMVKILLEKGANPDIPNLMGITPLIYAVRYDNTGITKSLLSYSPNVNSQDIYGTCALSWAVMNGSLPLVRLLISKGARTDIRNKELLTPLDLAHKSRQGKIARLLRKLK